MSLYNHGTEQKVKVQTARGEGRGPPLSHSLLSSSLHPGSHQVLNVGSCGPHSPHEQRQKGGWGEISPSPAGGGGEEQPPELRPLWNEITPPSLRSPPPAPPARDWLAGSRREWY